MKPPAFTSISSDAKISVMKKATRMIILFLILNILLFPVHTYAIDSTDLPVKLGQNGKNVYYLQTRLVDLGYLHFRPSGYFGDITRTGLIAFQKRNWLPKNGVMDVDTYTKLFAKDAERSSAGPLIARVVGPRTLAKGEKYGELLPWDMVDQLIPKGASFEVQDLYTGNIYSLVRTGGDGHLHASAATGDDLGRFLKCFGGQFTWEKRPAVVTYEGKDIACSVFGYPNGKLNSSKTEIKGDICIFFYGSTSDFGGLSDAEHDANILLASMEQGVVK